MSLVGDRGYYIRNTLEYGIFNNHFIYAAFDFGKVGGKSSNYMTDNTLIGSGIGLKGNFNKYGSLSYDALLGFPIKKPEFYESNDAVLNFSINYNF